jgi:integrase/recombinase XerD
VPKVAHRRLAELPRRLDPKQFERFIDGLDRSTPCGLRDRAMILCVARLGLRASEVVHLRLEDIDWRSAILNVPTRKTGRGALLPLVADVGEAIVEYIENGRPKTTSRHLFVLHHFRIGEPASPPVVSNAVSAALDKAGIEASIRGANLLRHTLATSLIRSGASLKEIADLMGHCRLEATQIYAKLDTESLREVAQPWPEVAS